MKVTIYHTTNCPFCKVEMEWLQSKNIPFNHINIEEDPIAMQYIQDITGSSSVPITIIERAPEIQHIVRGFDRKELAKLLDK